VTHIKLGKVTVVLSGNELLVLEGDIHSNNVLCDVLLNHAQQVLLGQLLSAMENDPPVQV
jgi:hypothetical protein